MDKLKAAYDEGLAMGHYQADSMYAKSVREQNKMSPCLKAESAKNMGANKQDGARGYKKMGK